MTLTNEDKQALLDVRKKKDSFRRAEERYKDAQGAYLSAQKLTGMPSGSSSGAGLEMYVDRVDKALSDLTAANLAYTVAIAAANEVIDKIVVQVELERVERMRNFCKAYFIDCLGVREAAIQQGMAESTGWAYRREVVGNMKER